MVGEDNSEMSFELVVVFVDFAGRGDVLSFDFAGGGDIDAVLVSCKILVKKSRSASSRFFSKIALLRSRQAVSYCCVALVLRSEERPRDRDRTEGESR